MGPCEQSAEPVCTLPPRLFGVEEVQSAEPSCASPRLFVADGVEEVVDNALSEESAERGCVLPRVLVTDGVEKVVDNNARGEESAEGACTLPQLLVADGVVDNARGEESAEGACTLPQLLVTDGVEKLVDNACGEESAEGACTSPRLFVADVAEELVDNAAGESCMERTMEPPSSLNISSASTDRDRDDSVVQIVAQQHCCADSDGGLGTSGGEDGHIAYDHPVAAHCDKNSVASVQRADLEYTDGPEDLVCDALGERLHELVVVPCSGSDIGSQVLGGEKSIDLVSSFEEDCGHLNHSSDALGNRDDTSTDTNSAPIIERHDVNCGPSDINPDFGNASSIDCRLSRSCLDGGQCDSQMSSCLSNLTVDVQGTSGIAQLAGAPRDSVAQYILDTNADCSNPIRGSLVEAVCGGTMDNGSSKSLLMPDSLGLNGCTATHNFILALGSTTYAGNTGVRNAGADGDTCELKCPDASSLPLRRSSRSRKFVQQVERGKKAMNGTTKASKVSLCQTIDLLSEATRKRRSSLSRSICSSGWGMSENLSKHFLWSNKVAVNQIMDQRSKKTKAGQRSRKKNVIKVDANSQFLVERQETTSRPIRLKVTFGKKEDPSKLDGTPPVVVDTLLGFQLGDDGKQLNLCSYIESSKGNVIGSSVSKEMPRLMQCSNSASIVQLTGANPEMCSLSGKSSPDDSSQLDYEKRGSPRDKFSNPGTSPDSEVIDQVLDSTIGPRALTSLHDFVKKVSCDNVCPRSDSFPASSKKSKNRRNRKDKLCKAGNLVQECQHIADKAKLSRKSGQSQKSKKGGQSQKLNNDCCSIDNINIGSENPPSNTSSSELVSTEFLAVADEGPHKFVSLDDGADINNYSRMINGIESADSGNSCPHLPPADTQEKKKPKGSRSKGKSRNKSEITDAISCQKESSSRQKGKKKTSKHKVMQTGIVGEACKFRAQPGTGNHGVVDVGTTDSSSEVALEKASCLEFIRTGAVEQTLAPRVAWVCCDDCLKWRCIPAELADAIEETNCRWTCKDNQDQAFADCAIPQEKSNAEINAELQISDEEDARNGPLGSKGSGLRQLVASQPSTWMLVNSNQFLHRSRKTQTMDEIMVCHCKPPADGSLGCGSQCLNRMLNIECVLGTCPCGDLCSNQQFQRQQYAKLSWFRCGKKGYGLQVLEDISEGQFLIEYVGEVLDLQTYEGRQKDYALQGHKHFYFMTLNGNEVIDACTKGNLGRFVNHSCDPNCRTEKWVVNGEICVGLFALRRIKKGEELTFDYNYVRVFGAAAKKCHCGSRKCRGYIGGDPLNAEVIVQGDSDEEFPEPVLVNENGEIDHSLEDMMAKCSSQDLYKSNEEDSELVVEAEEMVIKTDSFVDDGALSQTMPEMGKIDEVRESTDSSKLRNEPISAVLNNTSKIEHMSTPTSSPQSDMLPAENAVQKSISGSVDSSGRVSEVDVVCKPPHTRSRPRMKISRPSKSLKNRKSSFNSATIGKSLLAAQRSKILSCKPKRLLEGSANGHLEGVEEKLNELLDADGGICKKKDASKGYLKLLLLTAASGDSGNGGAIQSNRDLSMILDAILKTKSRGVLLDIINKNGLQMLHNMMKLYRRDFKKIPILRKLLKVLEFLAEGEILTVERINGDPLHAGVESLRESILFFTNHEDNQVYRIARNFRDRWIPHSVRRFNRMEKIDRRREFRRGTNSDRYFGASHHWREQGPVATESMACTDHSGITNNPADARMQEASSSRLADSYSNISRTRKRKSRWDQPADSSSPKKTRTSPKVEVSEGGQTSAIDAWEEERDCCGAQNLSNLRDKGRDEVMQNSDDDAPPGFSYPRDSVDDTPPGFCSSLKSSSVALGLVQERFNPRLPIAFGMPFSVVEQFGTLKCGTVDTWAIAPAMPFQPFPPLPPYRRNNRQMGDQEARHESHSHASNQRDQGMPSTSGASLSQGQNTTAANHNMFHHEMGHRNFPGKRNYRHKKWNNQKPRPPWLRNSDGWGFKGNYPPHPRCGNWT